jgi:hypothetical protein
MGYLLPPSYQYRKYYGKPCADRKAISPYFGGTPRLFSMERKERNVGTGRNEKLPGFGVLIFLIDKFSGKALIYNA